MDPIPYGEWKDVEGQRGVQPTWSIAHGMRHLNSSLEQPSKMNGNDELIAGAAWMAGNAILPMASESWKPKIPMNHTKHHDSNHKR